MKRLEPTTPPVSDAILFVCEKCGKRAAKALDTDENFAKQLQKSIKRSAKDQGQKHAVRAVLTGCLDLCPDRAIVVAAAQIGRPTTFFVIDANDDFEKTATDLIYKVTSR